MKLILASQSPYRRQQLVNFGLNFEAVSPLVDEEALKRQGPADLVELTRFLSEKKALSLREQFPSDVIVGSDQLVELEGQRLDKPGARENAFKQLSRMSGKEHRLITSVAVAFGGEVRLFTESAKIRCKVLSPDLINSYLEIDKPFDCAGSYKIEMAGLSLIDSIESADPSAIQGLSLMSLLRGLESFKISVETFW